MTHTKSGKKLLLFGVLLALAIIAGLTLYFLRPKPASKKLVPATKKRQMVKESNELFSPIPIDASEEVKVARYHEYQRVAKEAPYLEIKDCKPNPLIIKVLDKPNLVIKNSGGQDRSIWIGWDKYTIPAKGQFTLPLDFAFKQKRTENGTIQTRWWYACDLNRGVTTGIIWVGIGDDR